MEERPNGIMEGWIIKELETLGPYTKINYFRKRKNYL